MDRQLALHRLRNIAPGAVAEPNPCRSGGSFWDDVKTPEPDEVFGLKAKAAADKSPAKVVLGVGAYRDNQGKPQVLNVVRKAQIKCAGDLSLNREYLSITGDAEFSGLAAKLIFGADRPVLRNGFVGSAQTLSGTGSLRLAMEFVKRFIPRAKVYISSPTWGNHKGVAREAGVAVESYRYWNARERNLDIRGMLADLEAAPSGSVIMLHASAHNPTGVDPTESQWRDIARVCQAKGHLPLFDSAYQGFATGDLDKDVYGLRYFCDQGFEMLVCQSFAKNFGLYNARVGVLHIVTRSKAKAKAAVANVAKIVRPMYSNPPADGARIVKTVLKDPQLYAEWVQELKGMSHRIIEMRGLLRKNLEKLGTPGDWSHITSQIGMFSFTGLNKKQVAELVNKHHCYLLSNGRISMAGINTSNVERLARAIDSVVRNN
jgi:aspartate aminotransferase